MLLRSIVIIIIVFFIIYNSLVYEFDFNNGMMAFINVIMSLVLVPLMRIYNYAINRLYLISYIIISSTFFAAVRFLGDNVSLNEYKELAIFSNNLLFFALFPVSIHYLFCIGKFKICSFSSAYLLSKKFIKRFQLFIYMLSVISMLLGIGSMKVDSSEVVQLPFKLGGIIQLTRTDIVPIIILMIIYSYKQNGRDLDKKDYLLFIIWGIFEMFVRMSKSAMLITLIPMALYFVAGKYITPKIVLKLILPLLLFLFISYSVIEQLRYIDTPLSTSTLSQAYDMSQSVAEESGQSTLEKIYLRIFMNGSHYLKAYPYVGGNNYQFDFSRLPLCVLLGGSAGYTTYYIDGFQQNSGHSSGTTGFIDALLIGGYSLCYITAFLLGVGSIFIDSFMRKGKMLYYVFFTVFFIDVVRGLSYSYLLAPDGFAIIVTKIFIFYLLYKYSNIKRDEYIVR